MRDNTMLTFLRRFIFVVSVFGASKSWANSNDVYMAAYAPFHNGQPWPRFPIVSYAERASNVWVHPTDPEHFPSMTEIRDPDADFTTVVLRQPDGTLHKTYNNAVMGPYLGAVWSGDFNGDGIPDFVAFKPGSGCGLAGENCTAVFAFSAGGDYRFTRVSTMGLGVHDLVVDPATKTFRFIHTSFRQGKASDSRYHSFWVHRFYKWNGMQFENDSTLQPIWIQYLNLPNHTPTKLLPSATKAQIWAEDPESEAQIEW